MIKSTVELSSEAVVGFSEKVAIRALNLGATDDSTKGVQHRARQDEREAIQKWLN